MIDHVLTHIIYSEDATPAVVSAITALVAYDDCAYLLNEKPDDVKMLALLGNPAAILLYSACIALQMEPA